MRRARAFGGFAAALALAGSCLHEAAAHAQYVNSPAANPVRTITISGISNMPPAGGTVTVAGSGFSLAVPPVLAVMQSGNLVETCVTSSGWTTSTFRAACGAIAAGTYDAQVSDVSQAKGFDQGIFIVTSTTTPSSNFGGNLTLSLPCANARCSGSACANGGTVTSWIDASIYGANLTCTGGVTFLTADPIWTMPNICSVVFDGSTGYCYDTSYSNQSSTTLYEYVAALGTNTSSYLTDYFTSGTTGFSCGTSLSNGFVLGMNGGAGGVTAPYTQLTSTTNFEAECGDASSSGSHNLFAQIFNAPNTIATSAVSYATLPSSGSVYVGTASNNTAYWSGHVYEIDFVNTTPTTLQSTKEVTYLNLTGGVTSTPQLTMLTPIVAGTASSQRAGGSHLISPTITYALGGGAATTTDWAMTYADLTSPSVTCASPPCTSDVTVSNSDGRSQTFNNAGVINASGNPETTLGTTLDFWWEMGQSQLSWAGTPGTSNVAGFMDQSGLANSPTQTTGADQIPTWTASDSSFGGAPSITSPGSPVNLKMVDLTVSNNTTPTAWVVFSVFQLQSTSSTMFGLVPLFANGPNSLFADSAQKPGAQGAGITDAIWGTALGTSSAHYAITWLTGTGSGATLGVLVDSDNIASAVTTTATATPNYLNLLGTTYYVLSTSGSGYANVKLAFMAGASSTTALGSTQLTGMCSYVKAKFGLGFTC